MDAKQTDWKERTLYKYRAFDANTLSLFVNREIYFAEPARLNDPYDCQISVTAAIAAAIIEVNKQTGKNILEKLEKEKKLSDILAKMEASVRSVGVLSLTQDPVNALMWSHYADEHRGLCIGFRFSQKITEYDEDNRIIGTSECHYCGNNPFIDFFLEFIQSENLMPWYDFWLSILSLGMVSKALPWRYENEVRVLRKEPGAVTFQPHELSEIVFGMRSDERTRRTIKNILSDSSWSHLKYWQVVRSRGVFGLDLVEV